MVIPKMNTKTMRNWSCDYCTVNPYKTAKSLERHVKDKHPQLPPPLIVEQVKLSCPEPNCNSVFIIPKCLENHVIKKHAHTKDSTTPTNDSSIRITRSMIRSQEERLAKMIHSVEKVLHELVDMKDEIKCLLN